MDKDTKKTEPKKQKETLEELKKENEALKKRVKELEKQINTYNIHFAKGEIR